MVDGPEVTVWHIDLGRATAALLALEAETPRVSAEERLRATKFNERAVGETWLAAHVALRLALERALGASVRGATFVTSPRGKPALPADGREDGAGSVAFSLSHTDGHALIAVAPVEPIGVDLETWRTVRLAPARRRDIEAAGALVCDQPLPDGAGRFLQAWVRLEATAKADGSGLAKVLTRAGVFGARRGQGAVPGLLPADMQVIDLALGSGLFGAVATARGVAGVRVGHMPVDQDGLRAFAMV